jgi:hypothetical protein
MSCSKFQPFPAPTYTGVYRFISGDLAKGMYFDYGQSNPRLKFSDAFKWLSGGINPVQLAATSFIALAAVLY